MPADAADNTMEGFVPSFRVVVERRHEKTRCSACGHRCGIGGIGGNA